MKLKTILIVSLTLISLNLFSQADCVIRYEVTGEVNSESVKYTSIEIPTSRYLIGGVKKKSILAFNNVEIKDGQFRFRTSTHMSDEFCKEGAAEIVAEMFKKKKEFISIFLSDINGKREEFKIPAEQISTSVEKLVGRIEFDAYVVDL